MFRWVKVLLGQTKKISVVTRSVLSDLDTPTYCGHCDNDPCRCDDEHSVLDIILDTRTGEFAADFTAMLRLVVARRIEPTPDNSLSYECYHDDGDPFGHSVVLEQTAADDPSSPGPTSI